MERNSSLGFCRIADNQSTCREEIRIDNINWIDISRSKLPITSYGLHISDCLTAEK